MTAIRNSRTCEKASCLTIIIMISLCVLSAGKMKGQTQQSTDASSAVVFTINDFESSPTWPIAVKEIRVGDKDVPVGKPVDLYGNWVPTVQVVVQNVSAKTIVHAQMFLRYPESGTGSGQSPLVSSGALAGRVPNFMRFNADGTARKIPPEMDDVPAMGVSPGDSFTFTFSGARDDLAMASQRAGGTITKVELFFSMFFFDDQSYWGSGTYWAPSGQPGHWIRQQPDAFLKKQ